MAEASVLTPGMNSPSIVNLEEPGWVALSAMVKRKEASNIIDKLSILGATGIFSSELKHYRPGMYTPTHSYHDESIYFCVCPRLQLLNVMLKIL